MVEAMQLDIFKMVMENLNLLIFVAWVICFLTVVITQVTKGLPGLRSIPTDLQVLVLSVAFTLVGYFAYVDMTGFPVTWYFVIAMIVIGFVLALVATKGWTYVADLFWRFQHKGDEADADEEE